MREDGQTASRDKVIVTLGNFANVLKNGTRTNHLAKSNIM